MEEVSGQDLCLTWTQPDSLHWTFEVSCSVSYTYNCRCTPPLPLSLCAHTLFSLNIVYTCTYTLSLSASHTHKLSPTSPPTHQVAAGRVLKSVVLFDALAMDFTILGVWLLQGGARHQQALSCPSALQGAGLLLQQRLVPPDKVHVKVGVVNCEREEV